MRAKRRSLMDCRNDNQVCRLGRDNMTVGDFWIITDGYRVTIAAQKIGARPTEKITIPRGTFNRFVRFYTRQQKILKKP